MQSHPSLLSPLLKSLSVEEVGSLVERDTLGGVAYAILEQIRANAKLTKGKRL